MFKYLAKKRKTPRQAAFPTFSKRLFYPLLKESDQLFVTLFPFDGIGRKHAEYVRQFLFGTLGEVKERIRDALIVEHFGKVDGGAANKIFGAGYHKARRHIFFFDQFGQIEIGKVRRFLFVVSAEYSRKHDFRRAFIEIVHTADKTDGIKGKAGLNETVDSGDVDIVIDQRLVDGEHTARAIAGKKYVIHISAVLFQMIFYPKKSFVDVVEMSGIPIFWRQRIIHCKNDKPVRGEIIAVRTIAQFGAALQAAAVDVDDNGKRFFSDFRTNNVDDLPLVSTGNVRDIRNALDPLGQDFGRDSLGVGLIHLIPKLTVQFVQQHTCLLLFIDVVLIRFQRYFFLFRINTIGLFDLKGVLTLYLFVQKIDQFLPVFVRKGIGRDIIEHGDLRVDINYVLLNGDFVYFVIKMGLFIKLFAVFVNGDDLDGFVAEFEDLFDDAKPLEVHFESGYRRPHKEKKGDPDHKQAYAEQDENKKDLRRKKQREPDPEQEGQKNDLAQAEILAHIVHTAFKVQIFVGVHFYVHSIFIIKQRLLFVKRAFLRREKTFAVCYRFSLEKKGKIGYNGLMKLSVNPYKGKLGVAVSGGMDSMVLFDLCRKVQKKLVVINIEHGIRGEESVSDSDFVESYCRLCGVECLRFSVNTLQNLRPGESVELAARRLRYDVFNKLLADKTVDAIALAHHADDNAETMLMRIFRGTGIHGLIGMGDRKGFVRPLLGVSHKEIENYAEKNRIPYVTDSTNLVDDCTRNYIRHEIMPKIAALYPGVIDAFIRLSENAKEADDYILSNTPAAQKTSYGYKIKDCFGYPEIIQKYAIKILFEKIGFYQDIEKKNLDAVVSLYDKPNNTVVGLPFGCRALKMNGDLCICLQEPEPFLEQAYNERLAFSYEGARYSFARGSEMKRGITLDPTKIPEGSVIRARRDGDTFRRVNGKNKLLGDFLNEKKFNVFEKERMPVLADGNVVLAILGVETAEAVKAEPNGPFLHVIKEKE